ncbi:DUF1654 domain-containing protein [Pseudomonas syringae]|nr:DUF1654 domain-containing protein [Pseudomonas syringae]MCF5068717.1 DUF1654 domain-containing protein [Pseudomonas syringae]
MATADKREETTQRQEISGMERLNLRVSSMINHPVAQIQRWVTIHRLDADGDREWKEVIGLLSETEGIDMSINVDASVTLRWEMTVNEGCPVQSDVELEEEAAPF